MLEVLGAAASPPTHVSAITFFEPVEASAALVFCVISVLLLVTYFASDVGQSLSPPGCSDALTDEALVPLNETRAGGGGAGRCERRREWWNLKVM